MSRKTTMGLRSLSTINRSEFDDAMLRNNSRFDNRLSLEMQRYDRDMKTMARDLEKDFKMFAQKTGVVLTRTKSNLGAKPAHLQQREKTVVSNPSRFIPDFEYRARKREKTRLELLEAKQQSGVKDTTQEGQGQGQDAHTAAASASHNAATQNLTSDTPSIITGGVTSRNEEAGPDERSSAHKGGRGHSGVRTGRRSTEQQGGGDWGHAPNGAESLHPRLPLDHEMGDPAEGDLDWQESGRASKFSVWSTLSVPKHRNTSLAVRERLSKEFSEGAGFGGGGGGGGGAKQPPSPKRAALQHPGATNITSSSSSSHLPVQSLHLPHRVAGQQGPSLTLQGKGKGQRSNHRGHQGQGHPAAPPSGNPRHLGPLRGGGGGRGKFTPRGVEGAGGLRSSAERGPGGLEPLGTPRPLGMTLPLPAVTGTHMQRQRRDSVVSVKN